MTTHDQEKLDRKHKQQALKRRVDQHRRAAMPDLTDALRGLKDYEAAAVEILREVAGLGLKTTVVGGYKTKDADGWEHHAFSVVFETSEGGFASFPWRQGTGIQLPPEPAEVLACVCRDYRDTVGQSWEDWASDMGADPDSVKARDSYLHCQSFGKQLRAIGLTTETIDKLADLSARL